MGEQLVLPELTDYRPLSDGEVIDKIFHLTVIANEINDSLANPEGLIKESVYELQHALVQADREISELTTAASARGIFN